MLDESTNRSYGTNLMLSIFYPSNVPMEQKLFINKYSYLPNVPMEQKLFINKYSYLPNVPSGTNGG